jgi:hypothetical protein
VSADRSLDQVDLLGLAPVRTAAWEECDGVVVITRPRPCSRGLRRVRDQLAHWWSPRTVRLDAMGSFVWLRLDGRTTVGAIAEAMTADFEPEHLPERVGLFVRGLRQHGLVAYPGWDEGAGEAG